MAITEKLSNSLEENVLTLLVYSDSGAGIISGLLKPDLFDNSIYRRVAQAAISYYDKFRKSPKAHLADLLESDLNASDRSKRDAYRDVLGNLHHAYKNGFNEDYILTNLREFLRTQRLKAGILKSARLLQSGKTSEAEDIMLQSVRAHDAASVSGIRMEDALALVKKLRTDGGEEWFKTGITALDRLRIGPARKTLSLFMAPTNRGKSWALVHCGKHCLMQRLKVLHVTLEMSETKIMARYLQALFGLRRAGSDNADVRHTLLSKRKGEYMGYKFRTRARPALTTQSGLRLLRKKLRDQHLASRLKLVVTEFPTSSLSTKQLDSYLDSLERMTGFVPDVLILDYADLMELNVQFLRTDTGRIYKELRGLGVRRNLAVITATQSNRSGEDVKYITMKHASEDYSKAATSDLIITYNQTRAEKQLGLARLLVAKARDDRSGDVIVVSQSYETGQFHLDSALLVNANDYLQSVKTEIGEGD